MTDRGIQRFGIIIGAMKAGTTAAFKALGQHSEVALSREKETDFFVTDERFCRGLASYESIWDWDSSRHKIAVEASPRLTMVPEYSGGPARIASTGRDIRLVYLVRDPVRRIQSHYVMYAALDRPITPLIEGVDENALSFTQYHFQISQYANILPRSKILVITYEQLVEQTQTIMSRICGHFGLSPVQFSLPLANWTKDAYIRPLLVRSLVAQGIEVEDDSMTGFQEWFARLPSTIRRFTLNQIKSTFSLSEAHCQNIMARLARDMRALHKDFAVDVTAWGFST